MISRNKPEISRTGQLDLRAGRRAAGRLGDGFAFVWGLVLGVADLKKRLSATKGGLLPFDPLMPVKPDACLCCHDHTGPNRKCGDAAYHVSIREMPKK